MVRERFHTSEPSQSQKKGVQDSSDWQSLARTSRKQCLSMPFPLCLRTSDSSLRPPETNPFPAPTKKFLSPREILLLGPEADLQRHPGPEAVSYPGNSLRAQYPSPTTFPGTCIWHLRIRASSHSVLPPFLDLPCSSPQLSTCTQQLGISDRLDLRPQGYT